MKILKLLIVLGLLFSMVNCDLSEPIAPNQDLSAKKTVKILKKKATSLHKFFSVDQQIGPNGGTIMLGDDSSGYCWLDFPAGALDTNYTIHFDWESESLLAADFGPHGLQFNQDVYARLSYMDADLTGVNQDSLRIYYYNENNEYELVPGSNVNTDDMFVYGDLEHFSRYAIGTE